MFLKFLQCNMQLGKVCIYILRKGDTPAGRLLFWEGLGLKWGSGINFGVGSGFREITKGSSMVGWEKATNGCFWEGMLIPLFTYGSSGFCPYTVIAFSCLSYAHGNAG